ncbi:MAG TPA: hypothetical protein DCM32_05445 [Xanthomonadaceae bacterium]|jgi:hypothetical protein|nr:hypothetical protein [Xanthomonadaceae bacterium]
MLTFAFPPARRRRRLALGGALFLAFDALLIGLVIAWITQGEHLGLAAAFVAVGVVVSFLLASALARPPSARLVDGMLRVDAAHRAFVLDRAALRSARIADVDLAAMPNRDRPKPLQSTSRWRTGDAMGWQADGDGRPVFCAITRIGPALRIDAGEAGTLLWTPEDPAAVKRTIERIVTGGV